MAMLRKKMGRDGYFVIEARGEVTARGKAEM